MNINKLTTHELCLLVSRATRELASRIAPPTRNGDAPPPGARLAGRIAGRPGDTPEAAMRDAIHDAGLAPAVAKLKAQRDPNTLTIPEPQRLVCKVCSCSWYREPKPGRPPTTCDTCRR